MQQCSIMMHLILVGVTVCSTSQPYFTWMVMPCPLQDGWVMWEAMQQTVPRKCHLDEESVLEVLTNLNKNKEGLWRFQAAQRLACL